MRLSHRYRGAAEGQGPGRSGWSKPQERPKRLALCLAFLAVVALIALPRPAYSQASSLSPTGSALGLTDCDDCDEEVSLTSVFPTGLNFGGTIYTSMYVGTNGYVTFGHGNSSYSPLGITAYTQGPIVAGQYDDLDPGDGGDVYYYQNAAEGYVVVTFSDVYPFRYPTGAGSGTNSFQIVLRESATDPQDFQIELRYIDMNWARSGNNSAWPTAGWSAGDQATYAELPLSGQSDFLDVQSGSNVGETGIYRWDVEGGVVQSVPTVNQTTAATAITGSGAESGGSVSSDGGLSVTARGVAYSTSPAPTIGDNVADGGSGTGSFSATLQGLATNTTYFIRAFATNALGTGYGPERSFTTLDTEPPTVTTAAMIGVTTTSAEAGGDVTDDGGATVTGRGVAYGTSPNPTTSGATVSAGSGTGAFVANLTSLSPGTTYYVRAYATNSAGTGYGGQETFTTVKLDQTVSFPPLADQTYGDGPMALQASASSSLPVTFESSNPSVAAVSGDTLTLLGAGPVTITARQAGDGTYKAAPPVSRSLIIGKRLLHGAFQVPEEKVYDGTDLAQVTDRSLVGVLPADEGEVFLTGGTAHYEDPQVGEGKPVHLVGAVLTGSRAANYHLGPYHIPSADIVPAPPHHITLGGPSLLSAGGPGVTLTVTIRDAFENPSPVDEATAVSLSTSGEGAGYSFEPGPMLTIPAQASEVSFRYAATGTNGGNHRITATRVSGQTLPGGGEAVHDLATHGGPVVGFRIEAGGGGMIGAQVVDQAFFVTITALDLHGNVATGFEGTVSLSAGTTLASGGTTEPFTAGVLSAHPVVLSEAGTYQLTARDGASASGSSMPFQVLAPGTRVRVELAADEERPAPGDTLTLTLTVTNWGTDAAENVSVPDPLEGQDRLSAITTMVDQGSVDPENGSWALERLEPGGRATMTLTVVVIVPDLPFSSEEKEES